MIWDVTLILLLAIVVGWCCAVTAVAVGVAITAVLDALRERR